MPSLPPHIATLANELRAEFAAEGAHEQMLVEEAVSAAVRLRLLHEDPRLYLPHTVDRSWDRDHDLASRAYFRAHRALRNARSATSSRPLGKRPPTAIRPESNPSPRPAAPASSAPLPLSPTAHQGAGSAIPDPREDAPGPDREPGRSTHQESGSSAPESHRSLPSSSTRPIPAPRPEPPPGHQPKHDYRSKAAPRRLFRRPPEILPVSATPRASPS